MLEEVNIYIYLLISFIILLTFFIILYFIEKPIFDQEDINTSFNQKESTQVQFDCSSRGIPTPQIIWLKNDKTMSEEDFGLLK